MQPTTAKIVSKTSAARRTQTATRAARVSSVYESDGAAMGCWGYGVALWDAGGNGWHYDRAIWSACVGEDCGVFPDDYQLCTEGSCEYWSYAWGWTQAAYFSGILVEATGEDVLYANLQAAFCA
jgi:hypothetical protein